MYDEEEGHKMKAKSGVNILAPPAPVYVAPVADSSGTMIPLLGRGQCDQMTRLCFQYLAIFSNENLSKSIQIAPKWVENFAQNQIILKLIAKDI